MVQRQNEKVQLQKILGITDGSRQQQREKNSEADQAAAEKKRQGWAGCSGRKNNKAEKATAEEKSAKAEKAASAEKAAKAEQAAAAEKNAKAEQTAACRVYTSPSPRDRTRTRMPSSA